MAMSFRAAGRWTRLLGAGFMFCSPAVAQEFRGLWVDAFHPGFRNSAEITQLVAEARAGHFNALIVEVRKRGDAYYNSNFEPKASDISPSSLDPLAELIRQAHNTDNGPRLEVHAWIVTYPVWNLRDLEAAPPTHPARLHPDWLSQTDEGATWSGGNYLFDPGHPGVQQHTFNVAMDIITRYDVDGLNFDYVRYLGNAWGYNPVAVARFNTQAGRSGDPVKTDPAWLQWRRDQVTALVRKVYLSAIAVKPPIKISADTICFAPGVTTDAAWTNSAAAYTSVLQDWRSWMEEGILDLNIPMAYFDQGGQYAYAWTNWNSFTKDHRYRRHAVMGPGIYLNSLSNALFQLRYTRLPSPAGHRADGVCGYSYAVPFDVSENPGLTRADFLYALTHPGGFDPNPTPLFASPVLPPEMPWKTTPTLGHLKGFVRAATNGAALELATLILSGPTQRTARTDATGFFGMVDLPPGEYQLTASWAGLGPQRTSLTVAPGVVGSRDFLLSEPTPSPLFDLAVAAGERSAIVTWRSTVPGASQVEFGLTTNLGAFSAIAPDPVTNHSVLVAGLLPDTRYWHRAVTVSGTNVFRSENLSFTTAGEIVIDNPEAAFSGSWTTGSLSPDKFGPDYAYAGTVDGTATRVAVFAPVIVTPGRYDVSVWYPEGSNRSTNAPHAIVHQKGLKMVWLDQTVGGGAWRLVATNLSFLAGTNGFVRIANNTGESNRVILADAVRFVYSAGQDSPPAGTVPAWWAVHYFGTEVMATLDHDGDGYPTWMEYVVGTDPTDAASRLNLTMRSGAAPRAAFAPWLPGHLYALQLRGAAGEWSEQTNLPLTIDPQARAEVFITNAASEQGTYRLKVSLPQ